MKTTGIIDPRTHVISYKKAENLRLREYVVIDGKWNKICGISIANNRVYISTLYRTRVYDVGDKIGYAKRRKPWSVYDDIITESVLVKDKSGLWNPLL